MDISNYRLAAVNVARLEMAAGAKEYGGNNRGSYVKKYLSGAGLDEGEPWCASFVSWCYKQCSSTWNPMPFAYNPSAVRLFKDLKSKGWRVEVPQQGDLVFWHRTDNPAYGHVGFVEYAHDGVMQTIEGNHTPKVDRFHYTIADEKRLLGFCRVGGK